MATRLSEAQDNLLAKLATLNDAERYRFMLAAEAVGPECWDALDDYFEAVAEEQDYHEDMRNFQRVL